MNTTSHDYAKQAAIEDIPMTFTQIVENYVQVGVSLRNADLRDADLSGANLRNTKRNNQTILSSKI